MEKIEINSYEDLYNVLDRLNESIDWNAFYSERKMPAPFLVNNTLPDKAVVEFAETHGIKDAVEFGCGEGRNAIYLAKKGVDDVGVDISGVAIDNAEKNKKDLANVRFICSDFQSVDFNGRKFDLVIDGGMFHHLAPHRRLQYRDLVKSLLGDDGYFMLLCFSADAGGANELDDLQFYTKRNVGVSFSAQRIRNFFEREFDIINIKQREDEKTDKYIDIPYLYSCIMRLKGKVND